MLEKPEQFLSDPENTVPWQNCEFPLILSNVMYLTAKFHKLYDQQVSFRRHLHPLMSVMGVTACAAILNTCFFIVLLNVVTKTIEGGPHL